MKKTVKGLIIAASVAAVVGVGAVSFAKWEAGSTSSDTVTGTTGKIVTMGNIEATDTLGSLKLVPYDQVDQFDGDTMSKGFSVTLKYDGAVGAVFKMNVSGAAASLIKYSSTETGTYAAIGTDTTITLNLDTEDNTKYDAAGTTYYFRLDSDTTADMNKGFTITFSAEAPTVE